MRHDTSNVRRLEIVRDDGASHTPGASSNRREELIRTRARQGSDTPLRDTPIQYRDIRYVSRYQRIKIALCILSFQAGIALLIPAFRFGWQDRPDPCGPNPEGILFACTAERNEFLNHQLPWMAAGFIVMFVAGYFFWRSAGLRMEQDK